MPHSVRWTAKPQSAMYFAAVVGVLDMPDIVPITVVVEPDPAVVVVVAMVTGGIEPVMGV